MLGILRFSRIAHRFSTGYVLARRVNGKLEVAEFDRTDKDFCFNPRMTARVSLNGEDGLVKIGGVYKVVQEGLKGKVLNIQKPEESNGIELRDWYGFIKSNDDGRDFIFGLNNQQVKFFGPDRIDFKSDEIEFDIACYLHDEEKLQAMNLRKLSKSANSDD